MKSKAARGRVKNLLTKYEKCDIIFLGSSVVILEIQRYGRNKETLIDRTYIESGEYRKKFDRVTDNSELNRILYAKAKEILFHRSGTLFEDMYWLDSRTGSVVASARDEKAEQQVVYSDKLLNKVNNKNLITIHNHPGSMPPSVEDFNSALTHGYSPGVVVCHDGTVYTYSSEQRIPEFLEDVYMNEFLGEGNSEKEAQFKVLKIIERSYEIEIKEV